MKLWKDRIRKFLSWRLIIGIILGGTAGFLYFYFIGCQSGTCPVKSNPYLMTLVGMLIGGILLYK